MGLLDGLVKNVFPKNTKLGKLLGSTRKSGTGIIGGIFEKKEKARLDESASLPGTPGGGGMATKTKWDQIIDNVKANPIIYGVGAFVVVLLSALGFKALTK